MSATPLDRTDRLSADVILTLVKNACTSTERLIIIGASTGGTEAIKDVLIQMPANCPGILVMQHMPLPLPVHLQADSTASAKSR